MKADVDSPFAQRPVAGAAAALLGFLRTVTTNRDLLREMVSRDLRAGHAGHALGVFWLYAHPIVVIGTYMLIFGIVIGSRLTIRADFPGDYTSYILSGLVPWVLTANVLGRGPSVFLANSNLVKQVVFPIEILLIAAVIVSFITYAPTYLLFLAYNIFVGGGLSAASIPLIPIALGLHALLALGVVMALAVLTPFLRDVRELVIVYTSISMYFTPALYLPDWVPQPFLPLLYLNPFSYVVWVYQDTFFFGHIAHPFAWIVLAFMSLGAFVGSLLLMRRLKPFLGNVI